jgi:hypothetical protein
LDKLLAREKETTMKNNSLDRLRGSLTAKIACLHLLIVVVVALLATPLVSFAQSITGNQQLATTAIFVDISRDLARKPIYPHDIKRKDLKVGDTLDLLVNGKVATGTYAGPNQVTVDKIKLALTFAPITTPLPILDLQPLSMSFIGSRDCQKNPQNTAYVCLAKVSSRKTAQSNLNWFAYVDFPGRVAFNPPNGSLPPGQSVTIAVSVPINACTPGLFYFQGLKNTHTITWACNPKTAA